MGHINSDASDLVARVRKIAGQVASIEIALSADAPCATILHRIAAARGAMNSLLDEVIVAHLDAHVAAPDLSDEQRARAAEELKAVIRRYTK